MSNNLRQRAWRQYLCTHSFSCFVLAACLASFSAVAAEADDYLEAITMEGEKVGGGTPDGNSPGGNDSGIMARRAGEGFTSGMSIGEFESELQSKYAGSAVFYKKLEKRNQIEIYDAYLKGDPYAEVRKKIMARFLKRR